MSRSAAAGGSRGARKQRAAEPEIEQPAPAATEQVASIEAGAASAEPAPEPSGQVETETAQVETETAQVETAQAEPAAETSAAETAQAEIEVQSPVNYDDEGLGEVEIDGSVYRFDSGKQGTALCLSARRDGAWRWSYLGELRWDGRDLRSKALDRSLLTRLSASLRTLAEQSI